MTNDLKEAIAASYKVIDPLIAHIRDGYADGLPVEAMFGSLFYKIIEENESSIDAAALLATAALFRAALDR